VWFSVAPGETKGDLEAAWTLNGEARGSGLGLGLGCFLVMSVPRSTGSIDRPAGTPGAAAQELRISCERQEQMGDWGHLVTTVAYYADAVLDQGRGAEASPLIERALEHLIADDAEAQISLRRVRARLLAERGDLDQAEQLAGE